MTKRKSLSYLIEAELEKATVLLAAKAITDKLQQIAEQLAKMDANDVMPLGDSMRDLFGAEQASSFESAVSDKLRSLTEQVRDTKNEISDQIDALEKGEPMSDLGSSDHDDLFGGDDDHTSEMGDKEAHDEFAPEHPHEEAPHDDAGMGDLDFDIHSGGPAGRAHKESVEDKRKMLEAFSADHRLVREFSGLLRRGKTVSAAAKVISENYAMDVRTVVEIITKVKNG